MTTYRYGAMSTAYTLVAENDFVAIAAIVHHYGRQAHLPVIYEPEGSPQWADFSGQISKRLDEIFESHGGFDKFVTENIVAVKGSMDTIKKVC